MQTKKIKSSDQFIHFQWFIWPTPQQKENKLQSSSKICVRTIFQAKFHHGGIKLHSRRRKILELKIEILLVFTTFCHYFQLFHSSEWSMSNFPCILTRNIAYHSMENLAFHSLLKWKKITVPILVISLISIFSLAGWENVLSQFRGERVNQYHRKRINRSQKSLNQSQTRTYHNLCQW